MSFLSFALALVLAQAPGPCRGGERVVLVPFQPMALSTAEARQLEDTVRRAMESTSGLCLEPRADTVAKVWWAATAWSPIPSSSSWQRDCLPAWKRRIGGIEAVLRVRAGAEGPRRAADRG